MIESFDPFTLIERGKPPLFVAMRARLGCGCAVYVGRRLDNSEVATAAIACSDEHTSITRRCYELLRASLEHPTDRMLIDVVDELLAQAAA